MAALVVLTASSMRCFFSFNSTSVAAPTFNTATPPESFEEERARLGDAKALITSDELDTPAVIQKKIDALPASQTPVSEMHILVWSPDSQRTVRITLPFWLLKMGRKKIDISGADSFDFDRLRIDVNQLERIGPQTLVDLARPGGERVLVWTK